MRFFFLRLILSFQHKGKLGASETLPLEDSAACDWPTYIQIPAEGNFPKGHTISKGTFSIELVADFYLVIQKEFRGRKIIMNFHFAFHQPISKLN